MLSIEKKNKETNFTNNDIETYVAFLYQHLEQYGDKAEDITKAIHYALGIDNKPGGAVFIAKDETKQIVGIAVVLDTLMEGFIPEHILVYIAADSRVRGKGIGSQLIEFIKKETQGSIALHVDKDNPAQNLYERMGFEKKYIEMRLSK